MSPGDGSAEMEKRRRKAKRKSQEEKTKESENGGHKQAVVEGEEREEGVAAAGDIDVAIDEAEARDGEESGAGEDGEGDDGAAAAADGEDGGPHAKKQKVGKGSKGIMSWLPFSQLPISELTMKAIDEMGFKNMTQVYDMERLPAIFTYKDEAYVIHLYRGIGLDEIVNDVSVRWTLSAEQVELKCAIPERPNSSMRMLNGDDVDRMIDMHTILGSKVMNVEVIVRGDEEVISFRPYGTQSSGSNNMILNNSGDSSQDSRKMTDLWWCDELQNFVASSSSSCCCHKDDRIGCLEICVDVLEQELERCKALLKKSKMVAQALPKAFSFLTVSDANGGSDGDSDEAEIVSRLLSL